MKITQVEQQKKNPRRFNIFLDGIFAFGADEDLVVNYRLLVGKEILPEDLPKLLFEGEIGKLMERMYGLFSVRQRSEREVRDYLKRLTFKRKIKSKRDEASDKEEMSEVVVDELINVLKQKNMVNDLEFAAAWIKSRRENKKKGINALKSELYQKGIARETIEEVMGAEREGESEEDLGKQALEKKSKAWRNLPEPEFKKKATEFLVRRGFDYSVAKDVVETYIKTEYTNS